MTMTFSEMATAVEEARSTLSNADNYVGKMAKMLVGRLRKGDVPIYVLSALKKELRDWNIHTNSWKDTP